MQKLLLCIIIILSLCSCIIVDDFNEYWDRGTLDPALDAVWSMPESQRPAIVFSPSGSYYEILVPDEIEPNNIGSNEHAKTLTIGSHTFLMIKTADNHTGGDLVLYTVNDNKLTLYAPMKSKRESFEKAYAGNNITLTNHTARITTLDVRSIRILQSLAAKPDYWQISGTYFKQETK